MKYWNFRTGLTFRAVRLMLAVEARQTFAREGRRMYVTRRTVLGRWREIKLAMFRERGRDI